ncbi:MAG TPA: SHOCT domain-containing protein [Flavisolibacter sp.]|nr:SHOCT domain-containing protein [Flavisolibacter sp.]
MPKLPPCKGQEAFLFGKFLYYIRGDQNHTTMGIFIFWIICAIIVGAIATDKAMGFWGGFLWSILLSPLIGIIIVLASKSKTQEAIEQGMIQKLSQPTPPQSKPDLSITEQLTQLEDLKSKSLVTEEEYQKMRSKIMAGI